MCIDIYKSFRKLSTYKNIIEGVLGISDEGKIDLALRLALDMDIDYRIRNSEINVGMDLYDDTVKLIIRYTKYWPPVAKELGIDFVELLGEYGIINVKRGQIEEIATYDEILQVDKPKRMFFEKIDGINKCEANCYLYDYGYDLRGAGVYIGIIDSGVDVRHEAFRDNDSLFYKLWDQSFDGNPPFGFDMGTEYIYKNIYGISDGENESIQMTDFSGHGTAVTSIAHWCAPEAKIIAVKLNNREGDVNTADVMMAIDYCARVSLRDRVPIAINLSFGNNYGDHAGNSLLETYIDTVARMIKGVIVVGSGNEGASAKHKKLVVLKGRTQTTSIIVGKYLKFFNIQIWRGKVEDLEIYIITPLGERIGPVNKYQNISKYYVGNIEIIGVESSATSLNRRVENYIAITTEQGYVVEGEYKVLISNKGMTDVELNMWLPVADSASSEVYFQNPTLETTLTIPSTAKNIITVGAYDKNSNAYASFSGRGYTTEGIVKPDIVAPGVDVEAAVAGGGYGYFTGTSFATPMVSALAARLIEYGVTRGDNRELYGEAITYEIIKNAKKIDGIEVYPNEKVGYGRIC